MTLKTLVTGVAAAAVVAGGAAGVTSIASNTVASPAVAPVVWDIPLQPASCDAAAAQLRSVIDGLLARGVPARRGKSDLVENGVGFADGALADHAIENAYVNGSLPVAYEVSTPVCNGPNATATLSANGQSMNVSFVRGGRFGWSLSRASATQALNLFS